MIYKRKVLVELSIEAENYKQANREAKFTAERIPKMTWLGGCEIKSAKVIPNYPRRIIF